MPAALLRKEGITYIEHFYILLMCIQIWHPCGFANMIVYPERELSPEGVALGWQCSRGVDYHVGKPTGMSYLFLLYQTTPLTPGHLKSMTSCNLQTHLGSAISKQQVNRANHAGMSYLFYHTEPRMISTGLWFYFFFSKLRHLLFSLSLFSTLK